mgnify:CR=1 FL=1
MAIPTAELAIALLVVWTVSSFVPFVPSGVLAALTVVGLIGEEGRVIRIELIPVLYYGVMTGILTLLFAYVVVPAAF